jgi:hypothetical protein
VIPIETIRKAYARLEAEKIRAVLVGTAALGLYGFSVDAHDLDFLCERGPAPTPEEEKALEEGAPDHVLTGDVASSGLRTKIEGVAVDYIDAHEKKKDGTTRERFLTKCPATINGIPVADLDDVLGLKRSAGRAKDLYFLAGWDAARSLAR